MSGGDTVLVFCRTNGYRHESIPAAKIALTELITSAGLNPMVTEDPELIRAELLDGCAATVFLSTTGTVLTERSRHDLEAFVRGGGGFMAVHSAANTEWNWPFYAQLLCGAGFLGHPPLQPGVIQIVDADHPATAHLPKRWPWVDEWYDFRPPPVPDARVLAVADETSYLGGRDTLGAGHPLVWCGEVGSGRTFYTALGHAENAYHVPEFRTHLLNGLLWTACRPLASHTRKPAE